MPFDRDCRTHIGRHAQMQLKHRVHFCKETLIWSFYWMHVLFSHELVVCALCHFELIWRTVMGTSEFESSSFVWSRSCVPHGGRAVTQSLLWMHRLHCQFVYSNLKLFSLTGKQANAIDESASEFVVMWQLQGGGNEETSFAPVRTTRQSNADVALLSHSYQDWIEAAKVSI